MNYTEMLFNRDERLVNLLNQADSKNLELIEEINNREDEIERLKSIIKEVREYINGDLLYLASKCSTIYQNNIEIVGIYDRLKELLEILDKENKQ